MQSDHQQNFQDRSTSHGVSSLKSFAPPPGGGAAVAVTLHHVQRVDMVLAARRDADDPAAQCLHESGVLPLRAADDDVVVGGQSEDGDQLLDVEALAGSGDSEDERVGVHQPRLVAEDEVPADGVLAEVAAAIVGDLLHAERHWRGEALRAERAQRACLANADGQCCHEGRRAV